MRTILRCLYEYWREWSPWELLKGVSMGIGLGCLHGHWTGLFPWQLDWRVSKKTRLACFHGMGYLYGN